MECPRDAEMDVEQLARRYFRLKGELSEEYSSLPWNTTGISQLANELAATERRISKLQTSSRFASHPGRDKPENRRWSVWDVPGNH